MKIKIPFLLVAFMLLVFTSCKKNGDTPVTDYSAEYSNQADDQQQVSTEIDNVSNDANSTLDSHPSINGNRIEGGICDAKAIIADSTNGTTRTVTITYDGTSCDGRRTRSGVVVLSMPDSMHWKDAGAVLTITLNNLKISRKRDNKSITLNGTILVTNVSGGLVKDLATLHTITHTIVSNNMSITFADATQRNWQISKKRVFTYSNGIVITTTGTHSDGSDNTIAEWGTNRNGDAFSSSTTQPMVISQDCDYRVTSGQITHTNVNRTFVVTFGLDVNGDATSCPGSGSYFFKVQWTNAKGVAKQLILPY